MPDLSEQVQQLLDRAAIEDLQGQYARCLDEKDFEKWEGLFTEDAVLTMPYETIKQPELSRSAHRILDHYPFTQHFLGQSYITVNGDKAHGRRYFMALHVNDASDLKRHADLGGWYDQEFRRVGRAWMFTKSTATFRWIGGDDFNVHLP